MIQSSGGVGGGGMWFARAVTFVDSREGHIYFGNLPLEIWIHLNLSRGLRGWDHWL